MCIFSKIDVRPAHSFPHLSTFTFPFGRVAGAATLGSLEIPHRQLTITTIGRLHNKTEPCHIGDVVALPSAWLMPGLLSRWHSVASMTRLAKLCWGIPATCSNHCSPWCLFIIRRSGSTFRTSRISQLHTFLWCFHAVTNQFCKYSMVWFTCLSCESNTNLHSLVILLCSLFVIKLCAYQLIFMVETFITYFCVSRSVSAFSNSWTTLLFYFCVFFVICVMLGALIENFKQIKI